MACLGSVLYDPASAATASTASLLAMTAFDTTNARITFTAPANGIVLVRLRVGGKGSASIPGVLLGVLDGATVRGRQAPISNRIGAATTTVVQREACFIVADLTPGNSYTWDAAYAVQVVIASTQFGWGGPNDTTASNAYGGLSFEVWETTNLLAATMYDPAVAATPSVGGVPAVMAALDVTNLRLAFTVPASGRVLVRLRSAEFGATTYPTLHLGVLQAATVKGRTAAFQAASGNALATDLAVYQAEFVVAGLTPAANLTWDAAFGIETQVLSTKFGWGGPNDAAGADAYGGFAYEIWSA